MSRTVKDPEVRKNELIEAAEELFKEKGYSNTSVADIVKKVDVAHGLFYYYFDSKEGVIDAIVDNIVDDLVKIIKDIIENESLDAKEKFTKLFFASFNRKKDKMYFIDYAQQKENILMYSKYMGTIMEKVVPLITKVIEQGVEEDVFDTDYPEEAVKFWLYGRLSIDLSDFPENIDKVKRFLVAEADFLDRILGTEDRFISEIWDEMLQDFEKMVKRSDIYVERGVRS